jgi:hypothetical protein
MKFPRKYKNLLEIELKDVEIPDYVWLVYAVCACNKDSCGWRGWMIEFAAKKNKKNHPTSTGDKFLSAMDNQICPKCGRVLFRTGASIKLEPSKDQTPPLKEGIDYDVIPIEYYD